MRGLPMLTKMMQMYTQLIILKKEIQFKLIFRVASVICFLFSIQKIASCI